MKQNPCPEGELASLERDHRKIDRQICKLERRPFSGVDQMQIRELKRSKLRLKEKIERLKKAASVG